MPDSPPPPDAFRAHPILACQVLKKEGGKMVIVNLQKTPFDHAAAVRVFARTDDFFALLLEEMGLEAPE